MIKLTEQARELIEQARDSDLAKFNRIAEQLRELGITQDLSWLLIVTEPDEVDE